MKTHWNVCLYLQTLKRIVILTFPFINVLKCLEFSNEIILYYCALRDIFPGNDM